MTEDASNVSYSVKELIARLDGKLDGIFLSLNSKADKQDVEGLRDRVGDFSRRLDGLETSQKERRFISERAVAFLSLVVAVAAVYLAHH